MSIYTRKFLKVAWIISLIVSPSFLEAAPQVQSGDLIFRHNIQILVDHGVVNSPVTTWPLSWDALLKDLKKSKSNDRPLPNKILPIFNKVLARALKETRRGKFSYSSGFSFSKDPMNIRGFSNTPRETSEIGGKFSWFNKHASIDLKVNSVINSSNSREFRADGSQIGIELGNWTIGASLMDRWWGPGWDGSLILSSNARPIPSLVINRNLTNPFDIYWLKWIGPWDVQIILGQLEKDRSIPNANFFGMRINFRPLESLEIGISRSAQWCGDSRPCNFNTFKDLWLGKDNVEDDGILFDNEPGNQMAGFDFRWSNLWIGTPISVYGQFIGEDEAGGLPSRYLAQFGFEVSGLMSNGSYRWFAEWAGTSCQALKNKFVSCGYRQNIYQSGYTYKNRIIGHGLDNDASVFTFGTIFTSPENNFWQVTGRFGDLNKDGIDYYFHSVAINPEKIRSIDIQHNWHSSIGLFQIGFGLESREKVLSGETSTDSRGFVSWLSK